MIQICMLGDVVSKEGCDYLSKNRRLSQVVQENKIDFVIANGENSAEGNGMTPESAQHLFDAGVDVITGGNHTWKRREIKTFLEDSSNVLRPANYPSAAEGNGYGIYAVKGYRVLVMNLLGCVHLDNLDSPFHVAEHILEKEKGKYDLSVLDFHAEATSEKIALARYLDGKISVIAGTHTHVATADEQVLPGGTGYVTDLGMCGSHGGVLGVSTDAILHAFLVKTPVQFTPAHGNDSAHACIFSLNEQTGKCEGVRRIEF